VNTLTLTTSPGKSVYLSTFFLDPCLSIPSLYSMTTDIRHVFEGYIKSPISKQKTVNPILMQTTIPGHSTGPKTTTTLPATPDPCDTHLRETMPAYVVIGKYLLAVLMEEIHVNTTPEVFDRYNSMESIVNVFHRQFALYMCQEPPFIYTNKVKPLM
jgi:hypothetical protein